MKETNMEHYRSEIERIISMDTEFAPAVIDGKPEACDEASCKKCLFRGVDGCAVFFLDKFGDNFFPFITWEDEEPWSIERLRELKVKENE